MAYSGRSDDDVFPIAQSRESMDFVIETLTTRIGTFWLQYVEGKADMDLGFAQFDRYLIP